jgi:hypothetical protein
MSRLLSVLLLGVALLMSAVGCRQNCCGSNSCPVSSNTHYDAPCQLTGNGKMMDGCYDAITGRPVPCPPPSTMVLPGGAYPTPTPTPMSPPNELPFPAPSDMIRPQGIPYAPPTPAPGSTQGAGANTKGSGTPVKGSSNN